MGLPSIRRFSIALLAAFLAVLTLAPLTAYAGNVTYTVDPASGRVTRATYPDGSYITYTYDLNGNRTSAVVTLARVNFGRRPEEGASAMGCSTRLGKGGRADQGSYSCCRCWTGSNCCCLGL